MTETTASAPEPKTSTGRTIARNTLFSIGSQLILRVSGFLLNVLIIRQLGDDNYGQYAWILAWANFFSFIGDLGITQYMTREYAREPEKAKHLFWDVTVIRLILALVTSVISVSVALLKPDPVSSRVALAIGLYTTTYFFMAIIMPLSSVISGYQRLDIISVLQVIAQVLNIAISVLILLIWNDFVLLVSSTLVTLPIMLIIIIWVIRRYKMSPPKFRISPRVWLGLIWSGLPFALNQIMLTSAYQFDTIIMQQFYASNVVGWYNAAYNLARSLLIFTSAFSNALGLSLMREYVNNPEVIRPWYHRSVKFMMFIGLPLAVGGMVLSGKLIPFMYGGEYAAAAIAFAIVIWDIPLLMYTSHCGNIAVAMGRERRTASIYATEAGINIFLNILLIPRYGIVAASFTTLATEFTGACLFYIMFRRELGAGLGFNSILRIAVAAGVMGVVLYLIQSMSLILLVPIGVVIYIVMALSIGALNAEERGMLTGFVQRKLGRVLGRFRTA
ncbi:MAG: flippase [Chloroflexi bacterium]|nr:flippase [Chloroflexota bacterium]MCC6892482.1 flippase [Anaerolineae bacterium]